MFALLQQNYKKGEHSFCIYTQFLPLVKCMFTLVMHDNSPEVVWPLPLESCAPYRVKCYLYAPSLASTTQKKVNYTIFATILSLEQVTKVLLSCTIHKMHQLSIVFIKSIKMSPSCSPQHCVKNQGENSLALHCQ